MGVACAKARSDPTGDTVAQCNNYLGSFEARRQPSRTIAASRAAWIGSDAVIAKRHVRNGSEADVTKTFAWCLLPAVFRFPAAWQQW